MAMFRGWQITRAGVVFAGGLIILAALIFGSIWFVQQRGEQTRREEAIKVAEQNLQEQSKPPVETGSNDQTGGEVATTDTPSQPSNQESLPATGIEIGRLLAVISLALAVGYYATSRRAIRQL